MTNYILLNDEGEVLDEMNTLKSLMNDNFNNNITDWEALEREIKESGRLYISVGHEHFIVIKHK